MRSPLLLSCALFAPVLSGCVNYVGKPDALMFVSRPASAEAASDLPAEGSKCRVTLRPHASGTWQRRESSTTYSGTLLKIESNGVLLKAKAREGRTIVRTPFLEKIPGLSRYFKATGVGQEQVESRELWIPNSEIERVEADLSREPATGPFAEPTK
jgi:hypothetical protein